LGGSVKVFVLEIVVPLARFQRCGHFLGRDTQMGFFEQVFGFSPDHGDRSFEVLLLVVLVAMIGVLAWRFFHYLSD